MTNMSRIVVVGGGQAGFQAVASLRQAGYDGSLYLIGEEDHLPYQRPPLSKAFLKGQADAESVQLRPQAFYVENRVELVTNTRVIGIDRAQRAIRTEGGSSLQFDRLVIATGTRPRTLNVEGAELDGVHYLRTIRDAQNLRQHIESAERIAIIGAGFIGLEVAACAATLGKSVTVIEVGERVMARAVAPVTSQYFEALHKSLGVNVLLGKRIRRLGGTQAVESVELDGDSIVHCDLVLIGVGAKPNDELASDAGIVCNDGIVVDEQTRTSDPEIYAIGDCCRHPSLFAPEPVRLESVQNAIDQAKVCAQVILGNDTRYTATPWFWSDQATSKLQTTGLPFGADEYVVRGNPEDHKFSVFHLRGGQIIAVDSVNAGAEHMFARRLVAAKLSVRSPVLADTSIELKTLLQT